MSLRVVHDRVVKALYVQIALTAIAYTTVTHVRWDDPFLASLLAQRPSPVLPDTSVCTEMTLFSDPPPSDPFSAILASLNLVAQYTGIAYLECGCLLIGALILNVAQWALFECLHAYAFMIMDAKKHQFVIYFCVTAFVWLWCVSDCVVAARTVAVNDPPVKDPPVVDEPIRPRSPSVCTSASLARSSDETR